MKDQIVAIIRNSLSDKPVITGEVIEDTVEEILYNLRIDDDELSDQITSELDVTLPIRADEVSDEVIFDAADTVLEMLR